MPTSTRDITKKERTSRASAPGTPVLVRLQPPDLAALDAFAVTLEAYGPHPSRPQAIRYILADWLRTHGFGDTDSSTYKGPATDVVRMMDDAIKTHRRTKTPPATRSKSSKGTSASGKARG